MLLFSTILDMQDHVTPDDFIKLVLEWNQGSKYADNWSLASTGMVNIMFAMVVLGFGWSLSSTRNRVFLLYGMRRSRRTESSGILIL